MFPVDHDETVLSVVEKTMKMDKNAGGIVANWVMFGSSGHKSKPDGMLIEYFLWRSKVPGKGTNCVKTICNPDCVRKFNHPHYPLYKRGNYGITPEGARCEGWNNPVTEYVGIRINHYFTKSKEQWIERRKYVNIPACQRSLEEFYEHDNNDILDKEILRYKEDVCRIMENYR